MSRRIRLDLTSADGGAGRIDFEGTDATMVGLLINEILVTGSMPRIAWKLEKPMLSPEMKDIQIVNITFSKTQD